MKILHLNSNYLTSQLHENFIDTLNKKGVKNTIFMPISKKNKQNLLYKSKNKVLSPITFNRCDRYLYNIKQRKIYNKMSELVDFSSVDIVHAHTLFTDGKSALKILNEYQKPYVVTVRGTDVNLFFKYRINLRRTGIDILKNASRVVFLSESNRTNLLKRYIKSIELKNEILNKSLIIPNGIDNFWFENEGSPKVLSQEKPINFIQVGRINENKNLLGSIEAIKKFSEITKRKSHFTIIGKREDNRYFKKIKATSNLSINIIESLSHSKLIDYYRTHDIFIMPSFHETFGLVYPEAMSQGLPVIYTRSQGFDGQFNDGTVGFSVNPNNPVEIAYRLIQIVENYDELSKQSILSYKEYNWDIVSEKYLTCYNKIVSFKY